MSLTIHINSVTNCITYSPVYCNIMQCTVIILINLFIMFYIWSCFLSKIELILIENINIHLVCINLMYVYRFKTQINNVEIQHFLFYFSYFIIVINRIIHYVTACKMYILILLSLLQVYLRQC